MKLISSSIQEQESEGYTLISVEIGEPSPIVVSGKELQCPVPETLVLKVPGGKLVSISTLVGVSFDNGMNWKFIDTQGKSIHTMKQYYPTLSTKLTIPEKEKPVFYKD
ncbi:MAG: hypothetical protein FJY20_00850 [Bacteroidetes bacterium]|nr:hypothetical protein [Bacteroidota bacterium]